MGGPGIDTELARLLHRSERLDLPTLRSHLDEARRGRAAAGPSLAQMLVQRGLVTQAELAPLLARLQAAESGSHVVTPRARPSGSWELPPLPRSGTGTEVARWALSSGEQSRPGPATGRPSGRAPVPSGSWEVRPAERTEVGRPIEHDAWHPGSRIGDYLLERTAGAGAMGVVFIARHALTGGRYAIKTLRNGEDATLVERFRREGEAQAKVDGHPNVARVHSMGEAHGRLYIVMELIEGENLDRRIRRGTPPWPEAARIVAGVARGLAHMHARGVLHRDLKPSNVLFDEDGVPKLVDFGLAKTAGADRLTLTGEVVGTPAYMAPEQALGHRDRIGPWTDAWALGGVLFYVLTGRPPFDGTTSIQVITRVAEEEAPNPRSVRPDVPPELDAVCRALMRRPANLRITPAEAAERLEAFAANGPAAPPPRRSRAVLALAGLAAAAVVAAGAALALAEPPPPEPVAVTTTVAPPPPDPATEAPPPAAPWVVGQRRVCVVEARIEGEYPELMRRNQLAVAQRLDMRWDVVAVDAGRVRIEGALEALVLDSTVRPVGASEPLMEVHFDSRRADDAQAPLRAAVGAPLALVLDAASGRVLELTGAAEAQAAIYERARALDPALADEAEADQGRDEGEPRPDGMQRRREQLEALARHRVPLLADPHALRETLNGALHAVPAEGVVRGWSLVRDAEVAGPYWPGGLTVEVELDALADEPLVRWSGMRRATFRPRWPPNTQGSVRRTVQGQARLTPARDRVVSGSFRETWLTEIAGQPLMGMSATYTFEVRVTDS